MAKGNRKPKRANPPPVSLGAAIRESLPFPVVHYPNHYGTFFAFAEEESAPVALCACSQSAIENLLRLKQAFPEPRNIDPLREAFLDSLYFPNVIAELSVQYGHNSLDHIPFVKGLCHRCNLISPSLRYCHEMYGTRFIQYYGWYVNQAYLRLGVRPLSLDYLPDVCPKDYKQQIELARAASRELRTESKRLMAIASGPKRKDIADDEVTYWRNIREEAHQMISLRRGSEQALRSFTKEIENSVRQEFGFRKVGEGWVSETLLYHLVSRILNGYRILRHHRPEWLGGLELDIYVPDLKVAFEYQGQQHFHPIRAWGGQAALDELVARDKLKFRTCRQEGIVLIAVDYTEPLTEEYIRRILTTHLVAAG